MIHEISHSLDWHARPDKNGTKAISLLPDWQTQYKLDSRSATGYARTNWAENFADVGMVAVHDTLVPGGFKAIAPKNWNAISHQVAEYKKYIRYIDSPKGPDQCSSMRIKNTPLVVKDNSKVDCSCAMGADYNAKTKDAKIKDINDEEASETVIID